MNGDYPEASNRTAHAPQVTPSGKLLALDVGLARIGVAVCDPLQLRARPHGVVERTSRNVDFERLAGIVRTEEAQAIICGLPLNMDGSEGAQALTVRKWAMRLAHALRALLGRPVPIIFWDERLSTFEANKTSGFQASSSGDDATAAAVVLQRYLDRDVTADGEDYGRIVLPAVDAKGTSPSP